MFPRDALFKAGKQCRRDAPCGAGATSSSACATCKCADDDEQLVGINGLGYVRLEARKQCPRPIFHPRIGRQRSCWNRFAAPFRQASYLAHEAIAVLTWNADVADQDVRGAALDLVEGFAR